ncbi:MAG TPA: family 10 glycosylhydrolase, partial [Verrucomicrobiae bacterium]
MKKITMPADSPSRAPCDASHYARGIWTRNVGRHVCPGLRQLVRGVIWLLAVALPLHSPAAYRSSPATPPKPAREMRAAWIATVSNIDWPSTNGLTTAQQKAELLAILDRACRLKLNCLMFQVRPGCDALYASDLEPWSEYLTGTMGKAPKPFFDPLLFAVEQAHKRGLELHAWFNPYRARHAAAKSPVARNHISNTRPELVRRYGKSLWLDPGEKQVQDYSLRVIMDVVRRYDIDGVHLDDYFYPYTEKDRSGGEMDFPDESSWRRYGQATGLSRDDWRRENVNVFVHRLYDAVKAAKPRVKVGISPFGIWRPGSPPQIQGYDAYAKLYADSRKWLASGWVDYFAPQLYWSIDSPQQSFPALLKWWSAQNSKGRLLVAGMDSTKASRRWSPEEIVNQIRLTRETGGAGGHVHWNMKALLRNETLDAALLRQVYAEPALVPGMPWLGGQAPAKPTLSVKTGGGSAGASWKPGGPEPIFCWVLQTRSGDQ